MISKIKEWLESWANSEKENTSKTEQWLKSWIKDKDQDR